MSKEVITKQIITKTLITCCEDCLPHHLVQLGSRYFCGKSSRTLQIYCLADLPIECPLPNFVDEELQKRWDGFEEGMNQ